MTITRRGFLGRIGLFVSALFGLWSGKTVNAGVGEADRIPIRGRDVRSDILRHRGREYARGVEATGPNDKVAEDFLHRDARRCLGKGMRYDLRLSTGAVDFTGKIWVMIWYSDSGKPYQLDGKINREPWTYLIDYGCYIKGPFTV